MSKISPQYCTALAVADFCTVRASPATFLVEDLVYTQAFSSSIPSMDVSSKAGHTFLCHMSDA